MRAWRLPGERLQVSYTMSHSVFCIRQAKEHGMEEWIRRRWSSETDEHEDDQTYEPIYIYQCADATRSAVHGEGLRAPDQPRNGGLSSALAPRCFPGDRRSSRQGRTGGTRPDIDADPIRVRMARGRDTVRVTGVNTPETTHPRMGGQPFGSEEAAYTTARLTGAPVRLDLDPGGDASATYGRLAHLQQRNGRLGGFYLHFGLKAPVSC